MSVSAPAKTAAAAPRHRRPAVVNAQARKHDLARIHMLKTELGWDEDLYRDVMTTVCQGVRSAAQLDITGRLRLIEHLQACKARADKQAGRPAAAPAAKAVRRPLTALERKLWSLWMQAADAGLVRERKMTAITAWVERQTGVQRIEWLNAKQQDLVIESLKRWIKRGNTADEGAAHAQG